MSRKGKISGRTLYTAEEYLKMPEYQHSGRLKSEIEGLERQFEKEHESVEHTKKDKKVAKTLDFEAVIKKLTSKYVVEEGKGYHYVKSNGRVICWVSERKYGISISRRVNGKSQTTRIKDMDELKSYLRDELNAL